MDNKKYIIIEGDSNDADYIMDMNEISDKEIIEILPMIEAIKSKSNDGECQHNFPSSEYSEGSVEELYGNVMGFKLFDDFVPYGEFGLHTITSIKIVKVIEELL